MRRTSTTTTWSMVWQLRSATAVALVAAIGCGRKADAGPFDAAAGPAAVASEVPMASASSAAPVPETPEERLDHHRRDMAAAVEAGQYAPVCVGTPWFSSTICAWVAAKAEEQSASAPLAAFQPFFVHEHWKHVYGRILSDADSDGNYEVSVGGYTHHCMLDTDETKYSSKGNFKLWVQEQPETREITVNSGATQEWVVLEEATLAQMLLDLAHSKGGIEAKAMAKNAMALIAAYKPYAERKGEPPAWPPQNGPADAGAPARATPAPTSAGVTTKAPVTQTAPKATATPVLVDAVYLHRVEQCCTSLHAAGTVAKRGQMGLYTSAAAACDLVTSQMRGGQRPDMGSVRSALRMSAMPHDCTGTF